MLQNTAILKIGGGLAAISGTAGAGYYAHTKGLFKSSNVTFENESEKNYLIVKTTDFTATATGELYDVGLFSSQKNFTCSVTVSENTVVTDKDDCEIYKLSNQEKSLTKAINNNKSINSKNIKEAGNYLKIKSSKLLNSITKFENEGEQLISIEQKTESGKLFGKLMPVYRVIDGDIVKRKTSFLYAKVKDGLSVTQPSDPIDNNNENYLCSLGGKTFDCLIDEITFDTTTKIMKDVDANSTLTNEILKTQDKHFKISMYEKDLNNFKFDATDQEIDVVNTNHGNNSEKYTTLTPLFKALDNEVDGKDNFWLSIFTSSETPSASETGYDKCQIDGQTEKFECTIYKFSSSISAPTGTITFANAITKTDKAADLKKDEYFLVKFSKKHINSLSVDKKIKLISSTEGNKKEYEFTAKNRLFIDPSSSSDSITVKTAHILNL